MEKEVLEVKQDASKTLSKVKTVFWVITVLTGILGVLGIISCIITDEYRGIGNAVALAFFAATNLVLTLPVLHALITIVKAAEYHNAKVESKYDIK